MVLLVAAAGIWFHRAQGRMLRSMVEDDLATVVRLKADQIAAYRAERLGDGAVLRADAFLAEGIARWLRRGSASDQQALRDLFGGLCTSYHYQTVTLIDSLGHSRLSSAASPAALPAEDWPLIQAATASGSPVLSDLHVNPLSGKPTLHLAVPLKAPAQGYTIVATVAADTSLNELVQSWPVPSRSAETVLVRQEGDSVLFLNDPRRGPKSALSLRLPLTRVDVPAVKAVLGYEGPVYGPDYAGIAVVAVTRHVPGSNWYLVSKVDQTEAFAAWHARSLLIISVMVLAMALVACVGVWAEQRMVAQHERERLAAEAERLAGEVRYETTLRGIGDGVIVTDDQGRVVLLNPVAEQLTGWSDGESRGRPLDEVFRIINETTRADVESPVGKVLRDGLVVNLANHTLLIARDGSERPIADSGAPVVGPDGVTVGVVLVFRDQSDERASESALRSSLEQTQRRERHVRALAQASRAALDSSSFEDAVRAVLDACRQVTGSPDGAVSLRSTDGQEDRLILLATDGEISMLGGSMALPIRGLRALAYREKRAAYDNGFGASEWAANLPADHMPLARVLIAPMATEGGAQGIIVVANKPTDYDDGDAAVVSALAELAALSLERARANDAMRASESTHRALIEGLPDIVERHDREGRHLFVSPIVAELVGLSQEQVNGKTHRDLGFPSALCDTWDAAVRRVFDSAEPHETEFDLDLPAGRGTFNWRLVPEFDGQGQVVSVLTVMRDITAQRQAEQTTRQMAALLDAAPNAVFVNDLTGRIVYANHEAARMHGYALAEFADLNIADLQAPTTRSLAPVRAALLEERGSATFEVEHRRGDGSLVPLELVAKHVQWGAEPAVLSIATDITQRRLMDKTQLFLIECGAAGSDFFADLAEYLATELDACYVCIDQLVGDGLSARTVAVWHDGAFEDNVTYALADTPCGQVAQEGFCWFAQGVSHLFPEDVVLREMGAESYAGCVLWSADGRAIGLIAVISREPGGHGTAAEAVLKLVAIRAAGELERRAAEQALRDREVLLARTGELAHVGGWSVDLDSRQMVWTSETFRIHELAEGEPPAAEEALAFYTPDSQRRLGRAFQRTRRGGRPFDMELDLMTATGAKRHVHVIGCRSEGDHGQALVVGAIQDTTARRRAEEALRLRLDLVSFPAERSLDDVLRFTLDNVGDILDSPIGFYHFVDSDQKNLTLQMWSTATERDFCHAAGKGAHYAVTAAGVWADAIRERQVVVHNDYASVPNRRGLPDGHAEVLRELVVPILRDNRVVAVLGVGNKPVPYTADDVEAAVYLADVTWDLIERKRAELERERLEAQLIQAQKMEAVGRLAGGVAHDFNNMLSVILGHVELAIDQVPEGDQLHDDLLEMQTAAQRSAELTRQLLAFARRQAVAPRVVDINDEVRGSTNMLRRLIGEDIQLLFRPGEPLWPVRIDPAQFYQVIANLCVNGRDAIDDGGSVVIGTCNVTFGPDHEPAPEDVADGDYVQVSVTDTGRGMDSSTLANAFEPFFTTKGVGEGTGLGLAMVYGVVKQNDGHIDVTSELGRGTTFRLLLPRWRALAADEEPDGDDLVVEAPCPGTGTILLVEDESAILRVSRRILTAAGYQVLAAGSPNEALRLAHACGGAVDLLITDVIMPEMSGRELAELMVALNPELAVIFMSGYTADVIARHGVLEDGVHFLQKPFSRAALLGKVRESLEPAESD
ncbi:MAG: PAS domain S-box protein [Armatimonadetes bacterium]|nr:PAS domain S-box protein [Armatimonadota bacterium]